MPNISNVSNMPKGVYKRTKPAWNKGRKRTPQEIAKQKETCLLRYGVDNVSKVDSVRFKIHESHSTEEWKEKVKKTKMERYNDPNYNNMDQNLKTKKERYNDSHYNNMEKNIATKKRNHSFSQSKDELTLYRYLVEKYGADDVVRQYKEDRYPFYCDFYVRSKDLFIELNIHPCHNFKKYDPERDEKELQAMMEKAKTSRYWANMIDVWTRRDVEKLEWANKEHLNYITIYTRNELARLIRSKSL